MSADLLAEFGQAPAPAKRSTDQQLEKYQRSPLDDDPDQRSGSSGSLYNGPPDALLETSQSTIDRPWTHLSDRSLPLHQNSDVLFDVAFDTPASDPDDDWGDFEGPEPSKQAPLPAAPQQSNTPLSTISKPTQEGLPDSGTIDLLGSLTLEDSAPPEEQTPKSVETKGLATASTVQTQSTWDDASFDDWEILNPASSHTQTEHPERKIRSPTKSPSRIVGKTPTKPPSRTAGKTPEPSKSSVSTWDDDSIDDWGDFTDGPSAQPAPIPSPSPSSLVSKSSAPEVTVRPTNVPPPSILLQMFLDIFESLHKDAIVAQSALRSSASPPSSVSVTASNIHNTLQSAARVIAGRGFRWKRDTILSQSMRIGPARSGKGGMKLNSVNKQEHIKEEQDAVDVLVAWRERSAIFNFVLQGVGQRPIPAVADPSALKVITARAEQGALKASHPCGLCSLKRDERVLRIDESNVQDSFGDWWTEHWGHTSCRQFWEANRDQLRQR